jgi:hypothetical protein
MSEFYSGVNIVGIVKDWTTIQKYPELCKIFKEPPVLAFRKPKTLKNILVRAYISPQSAYNGKCQICDSRRCIYGDLQLSERIMVAR